MSVDQHIYGYGFSSCSIPVCSGRSPPSGYSLKRGNVYHGVLLAMVNSLIRSGPHLEQAVGLGCRQRCRQHRTAITAYHRTLNAPKPAALMPDAYILPLRLLFSFFHSHLSTVCCAVPMSSLRPNRPRTPVPISYLWTSKAA